MIVGVAVTKRTTWRGIEEEFSNVYHYDTALDATSQEVADAVVAAERTIFANNVFFLNVKVWGPTDGTALQSQMLLQQTLTGSGNAARGSDTAKELTAVVEWDTGRKNTRGGRIFLRKYLHLGSLTEPGEDQAKGNTALVAATVTRLTTYANAVKNALPQGRAAISDKKGRKLPIATDAKVLPHLHTRQFRR
jgi:hypothetical protein